MAKKGPVGTENLIRGNGPVILERPMVEFLIKLLLVARSKLKSRATEPKTSSCVSR